MVELQNRFLGCLLGCAVGDALGAPYEGLWSHSIPEEEILLAGFDEFEGYLKGSERRIGGGGTATCSSRWTDKRTMAISTHSSSQQSAGEREGTWIVGAMLVEPLNEGELQEMLSAEAS